MLSLPFGPHFDQTSARIIAVDPAFLASARARLARAGSIVRLSASSLAGLRHRRRRRRAAGAAVTLLLFLALLPSVVPYDHLFPHDAGAQASEAAVHVSHCHASPRTCSDAPISSGPGQLLMGDPLILAPPVLAILVAASVAVLIGVSLRPAIRPPLSLAS